MAPMRAGGHKIRRGGYTSPWSCHGQRTSVCSSLDEATGPTRHMGPSTGSCSLHWEGSADLHLPWHGGWRPWELSRRCVSNNCQPAIGWWHGRWMHVIIDFITFTDTSPSSPAARVLACTPCCQQHRLAIDTDLVFFRLIRYILGLTSATDMTRSSLLIAVTPSGPRHYSASGW